MNYLLDTDICSHIPKRPGQLFHRFIPHSGQLTVSTIGLSELYARAYKQNDPRGILSRIHEFFEDVTQIPFDKECARHVGEIRGKLIREGNSVSVIDLLIAGTALANDLTLVMHNIRHFRHVPGLRLEDWLED